MIAAKLATLVLCFSSTTRDGESVALEWKVDSQESLLFEVHDNSAGRLRGEGKPVHLVYGYELNDAAKDRYVLSDPREIALTLALELPNRRVDFKVPWVVKRRYFFPPPMESTHWRVDPIDVVGTCKAMKGRERKEAHVSGRFSLYRLRFVSGKWVRQVKASAEIAIDQEVDCQKGVVRRSRIRFVGQVSVMGTMRDKGLSSTSRVNLDQALVLAGEPRRVSLLDISDGIERAIERGRTWLLMQQKRGGGFQGNQVEYPMGVTALSIAALLNSDSAEWLAAPAFENLRGRQLSQVYEMSSCLLAMEAKYFAIDTVGKLEEFSEEKARGRIAAKMSAADRGFIKQLAEKLIGLQVKGGTWGYPSGGDRFDHSNTQYALLGLKAASRCGVRVPLQVWRRAAQHFVDLQYASGNACQVVLTPFEGRGLPQSIPREFESVMSSWGYYTTKLKAAVEYSGSGSMTCAGLTSLIICMSELERAGELDDKLRKEMETAMKRGLAWLQENYTIRTVAPGGGIWVVYHHYYLYSLERVGLLYGIKKIGGHDWFLEGALWLVHNQREDGSWHSYGDMPVVDTAFALLFLKKAVVPVETPSRNRSRRTLPQDR